MFIFNISNVLVAPQAASAGNGNPIVNILPLVVVVVFFYFFMIRPQQKKYKEVSQMLGELKVGDKVATSSGIIGEVVVMKDEEKTVLLKTGRDTEITVYKQAIVNIIKLEEKPEEKK